MASNPVLSLRLRAVPRYVHPRVCSSAPYRSAVNMRRCRLAGKELGFGFVGPPLWSPLFYPQHADGPAQQKFKRSPKPDPKHISLEIPTDTIAGPLGFRTDLDIGPRVRRLSLGSSLLGAGRSHSIVALDENDTRASRVIFQNKGGKDQGLPAPGIPTTGMIAGGDEHGNGSTSECS